MFRKASRHRHTVPISHVYEHANEHVITNMLTDMFTDMLMNMLMNTRIILLIHTVDKHCYC